MEHCLAATRGHDQRGMRPQKDGTTSETALTLDLKTSRLRSNMSQYSTACAVSAETGMCPERVFFVVKPDNARLILNLHWRITQALEISSPTSLHPYFEANNTHPYPWTLDP